MQLPKKNGHGLMTTQAPFIENAREAGQVFIHQPYELYNEDNQWVWRNLYTMLLPKWKKYANKKFLEGINNLCLNPDRIPKLEEVNQFLKPLTGFCAKAVSGYVPTYEFFNCLRSREFPTTITIRASDKLHYLPEPDIFHDIAGHVPMHTDRTFAEILVKFGELAQLAKKRGRNLENNLQTLSRFFWFTIEFGLMREKDRLCVYGSGLLSSAEEIAFAVESEKVQRCPFQLEKVIDQTFEIDHFQTLLFVIDSFEHLYDEVDKLEKWLLAGRFD